MYYRCFSLFQVFNELGSTAREYSVFDYEQTATALTLVLSGSEKLKEVTTKSDSIANGFVYKTQSLGPWLVV
jgi:hypothetical protein